MDQVLHVCAQFEQLSASQFDIFYTECNSLGFIRTLIQHGIYHLASIKTRNESNSTANRYVDKIEELIKNIRSVHKDKDLEQSEHTTSECGLQSLDTNLHIHLCQYMDPQTFHAYKHANKSIYAMIGSKGVNYLYDGWFDAFWLKQKCCRSNKVKMIQMKTWRNTKIVAVEEHELDLISNEGNDTSNIPFKKLQSLRITEINDIS
eukprot:17069_1